jgi:hypothetical protein
VTRKPFDPETFQANDPPAREVVKACFRSFGVELLDNPDIYGVDLISADGVTRVEVERRLVWESGPFPYDPVHIPSRKARILGDGSCAYAIVSKDLKSVGMIGGFKLFEYLMLDPHESFNKHVHEGETFYRVPRDEFDWFDAGE